MITIPHVTAEIVRESPLLEDYLLRGLVNLSALAREIQPEVELRTQKSVQIGAIVAALKRLVPTLKFREKNTVLDNLGDISVRSDLVEYSFINSPELAACHQRLIERLEAYPQVFFNLTQGVFETNVIVSQKVSADVEEIYAKAKQRVRLDQLSAITLLLPPDNVGSPGTYYQVLKVLFWHGINLIEAVSTYQELTILFENKDIDRAFSVLQRSFYAKGKR